MTLYQQLVEAGCRIEHHCSDLYTPDTPTARKIATECGKECKTFLSPDDTFWLEFPFAYDPFWEECA